MNKTVFRGLLDRFEGDWAVVLLGEEELKLEIPRSILPRGAAEGSVLRLEIKLAPAKTKEASVRVQGLIDRLRKRSAP